MDLNQLGILSAVLLLVIIVGALAFYYYYRVSQKSIRRLTDFYEIVSKIASNINMDGLMGEIMEIARKETNAKVATLYFVDNESNELFFHTAHGVTIDKLERIRIPIDKTTLLGYVASTRQVLNIKDITKNDLFGRNRKIANMFGIREKALLTVPIHGKSRLLGIVQVINKERNGFFSEKDVEFINSIVVQIGITLENTSLYSDLHQLSLDFVSTLTGTIDAKDPYTNGHSQRVMQYAVLIGKAISLKEEDLKKLQYMAILHDIGKIGIGDDLLKSGRVLNNDEYQVMKTHVTIGYKILDSVKSLKEFSLGARYHHERYDGKGYFEGLAGDEIPYMARIITVADCYDAMTTDRPYRKALPHSVALDELIDNIGLQFDPNFVKAFISVKGSDEQKARVYRLTNHK